MTLAAQMLTDVAGVFLNTDEHAAAYSYVAPGGGSPVSIVGIWELREQQEDKSNGVEVVQMGVMLVPSAASVAREGVFTIEGVAWPVCDVGQVLVGMREIKCERRTKIRTGAGGNKFGK